MWYMHTRKAWSNEIERTVFELSFGLFDWWNYTFFVKLEEKREKQEKSSSRQGELNPDFLGVSSEC